MVFAILFQTVLFHTWTCNARIYKEAAILRVTVLLNYFSSEDWIFELKSFVGPSLCCQSELKKAYGKPSQWNSFQKISWLIYIKWFVN